MDLAMTDGAMPAPKLSVSGLKKSYGGFKAVDGVSFDVRAREIVAMIGPNGAGKSTCFNALNGQTRPDEGTIHFDGRDITNLAPASVWRQGIGRTFQITMTFSSMTVRENVQVVLQSRDRRLFSMLRRFNDDYREEADHFLTLVDLEAQGDRRCATLAYGDLKRLELAMALCSKPQLLLMDEPTAGMAPAERIELMKLTKRLVMESGISVLFTEHDMDVVFGYADRVIVLNRGSVIAQGLPSDVRKNPQVQEVYLGGGTMFGAERN
jgi:branched-chain amino acid transport system ATP-binding protein